MRDNQPTDGGAVMDMSAFELSAEKFNECANEVLKYIEHASMEASKDEETKAGPPPALIVYTKQVANDEGQLSDLERTCIIIDSGWDTAEAKRKTLRKIGIKFYELKVFPIAAFLICEAWVSRSKERPTMMPSEDPNRTEVVMVDWATLSKDESILIAREIIRDSNGVVTGFKEEFRSAEGKSFVMAPFWDGFLNPLGTLKKKDNQ